MRVPAALLAVPFLTGSAAAILLTDGLDGRLAFLCAGAALVALIAAAGAALCEDAAQSALAMVAGSLLAGLSLGAGATHRAGAPPLLEWFEHLAPGEPAMVEGILREDAPRTAFGVSLTLDVVAIDGFTFRQGPAGGVRLSVGGELFGSNVGEWRAGRTLRVAASLRRPSIYLNPGLPDERRSLARRGIVLVGSVKSAALVEVVRHGTVVAESAAAVRAWTRRRVAAEMARLDPKSAGVTTAVLIGDRSGLAPADERRMQEAGTYHVIAISGGNIAILAVLILFAGRLMLLPGRWAAVLTAALLIFYGAVAAGAPSVSRAVTVAVLVLAAHALDHRVPGLNVLSVAAILAVAASPLVVLDAGFILSFGATLGILLGVPLVAGAVRTRGRRTAVAVGRVGAALLSLLAATACAEIALAPVGATLFARVPLAGLLLNFAAIPLMTVVQIGGLAVAATSGWWPAAAGLAGLTAHLAAAGLLQSARLVDVAPWLSLGVQPPAWWVIAAYYASALGLLRPRLRGRAAACLASVTALMLVGTGVSTRDAVAAAAAPLRVVVLDVGQGDAALVSLPGGRALLVDAGGLGGSSTSPEAAEAPAGFDVGERLLTPALRALGVSRLDAIVLTHGDPDHILGARGVLRTLPAASVWEGVPVPPHPDLRFLNALAQKRSMSWRTVQAGDAERFGSVEIRVLHPPLPEWERQRVRNDDSVVLEVRVGRVSVILPGDIGQEGERAILSRLEPGRLVVLKAPHHGSAGSSTRELLDVLRPAAVIFSCGRDNRFGHPNAAVVARYRALGSEIFSTAEDGAVFVETDGITVEVRGWTGRKVTFPPSPPSTPPPSPPASRRAGIDPAARIWPPAPRIAR